jgi:hypothetical protein
MIGWRNVLIILTTVGCQTFVAWAGISQGTEAVGLATILGAVGGTAVGGAYARGYNKKHAPEG